MGGKLDPLREILRAAFVRTSLTPPSTAASGATPPSTAASGVEATPPSTAASGDANVRPTDEQVGDLAKLLLEKRLTKCRGRRADALANGRGALVAITAILIKFFARLTDSCAKIIFNKAKSAAPIETLEGNLFLTGAAAERAEDAFTKHEVGVYYYEAPFRDPGNDVVKQYESFGKDNGGDGRGTYASVPDYGEKFINKCKPVWDQGMEDSVRIRYTGKKDSVQGALIERGVAHFNAGSNSSGAKLFHPAAVLVPGLNDALQRRTANDETADARSRVAESISAAAFLDWHDINELVKELEWEPKGVCWFSESVMMALVRTRCFDKDGGFGTNVQDGFKDWNANEGTSSRRAGSSGQCAHGKKNKYICVQCSGCAHGKLKHNCVTCNPCAHGTLKKNCTECSGCEHGKLKFQCAECKPCAHGKLKYNCTECSGCEHGKLKKNCTECSGCEHGKLKLQCAECKPCAHGKVKYNCTECNPCAHGKLKKDCTECSGCEHGKLKFQCAECKPCAHGKVKRNCAQCRVSRKRKRGN